MRILICLDCEMRLHFSGKMRRVLAPIPCEVCGGPLVRERDHPRNIKAEHCNLSWLQTIRRAAKSGRFNHRVTEKK